MFLREDGSAIDFDDVRIVAPPTAGEVRRAKGVEPQVWQQALFARHRRLLEHARIVRISDELLDDCVVAIGVLVGYPIAERFWRDTLDLAAQMAPFLVKERRAVRDQVLKIPHLRPVDGRVIDLREHASQEREPDAARDRVRGPDALLVGVRPAWLDTGPAESLVVSAESGHLCCAPGNCRSSAKNSEPQRDLTTGLVARCRQCRNAGQQTRVTRSAPSRRCFVF